MRKSDYDAVSLHANRRADIDLVLRSSVQRELAARAKMAEPPYTFRVQLSSGHVLGRRK